MERRADNPSRTLDALVRAGRVASRRMRARLRERVDRLARRFVAAPTESLVRYKTMVELAAAQAKIGVWECDLATDALSWSEGVYDLFELPPRRPVTRAWAVAAYDPAAREEMERLRERAVREGRGFRLDARIKTAKGNERWMRLTANVEVVDGVAVRLFGMKQDITEEKNRLERLRLLAETDSLTGLANRAVFHARLAAASRRPSALVLVDVDDFKRVNDTYGHQAGDACLVEVAQRLRRTCGDDALIARLGGDEFGIALDVDVATIEARVAALLTALRGAFLWNGLAIDARASIGVALVDQGEPYDPRAVVARADLALYAAKADGRDTCRIFSRGLSERADPPRAAPGEPGDARTGPLLDRSAA